MSDKLGLRSTKATEANPAVLCQAQSLLGRSLKKVLIASLPWSCPAHPSSMHMSAREGPILDAQRLLSKSRCRTSSLLGIGTSSNATHTTLPTKHPLSNNNIRPPFPLALRVIMIFPLILNYKYTRPRKGKGCWSFERRASNLDQELQRVRGKQSSGCRNVAGSLS